MTIKFANHKNEAERQIIVLLVEDCLAAGYKLGVNDGEETTLRDSTDEAAIFAAMSTTDQDYLLVAHESLSKTDPECTCPEGWIRLIYGNGGDVISDNTINVPESVFARANELAERFQ
jgi:hypothetical protein